MSLDSKLRALIEKEVKSSSKKTLKESVSDHELEVEAVDNGLEELIVCDANGNLTDESRDEIIQALKQVDQGKDELEEAYSDRNPKIDLYNKETGDYLASTNWSQTIEDAVTTYEKAYPDLAGNVVAELADGESEYQEDDEYLEDDELNEISKETSEDSDGDQDEFFTDPKLESVNLNDEDLVTEANEDLVTEANSNYDSEFIVYDIDPTEKGGHIDRFTIIHKSDLKNKDSRGFVPMLSSGVDPRGYSGHEEGVVGSHLGKKIKFSALPEVVQKFALRDYSDVLSIKEANEDDLEEAFAKINNKLDKRYQINQEFDGSSGKPKFVVRFMDKFIGSATTKEEANKIAVDVYNKRMKKDLGEANEDDLEDQDELDLTSDETTEDNPDLDDEETEEEPEKITVVVVSPELKKDDAEDDDLDSSYNIDDEVKNVKKHTDALSMNEDLSDEFKEKAKVIFEAALAEHSKELRAKFIKEFRTREKNLKNSFNKQVKDLKESLIKEQAALVDGYLSEAIDTWIAENSVILESNVKTELTEEFIDGLKNLFQEHYIEVPTEKFDLVKAQEEKIKQLEESVSEYKAKSLKNLKEAKKLKCESIINKATSGMTEVDKAKFIKLVESVDFGSIDQFERKVKTLKESYTTKSRSVKEQVLTENRSKRVETEVRTQSEPKLVGPADSVANLLDKISF